MSMDKGCLNCLIPEVVITSSQYKLRMISNYNLTDWVYLSKHPPLFEESGTNSTPIIEKLDLKIDNYKDQEAFLLAPIEECDVILGTPLHFKTHPIPDYMKKTMPFEAKERIFYTC